MLVAPALDVGPIEDVKLNCDLRLYVGLILGACEGMTPAELGDDGVFCRRDPSRPSQPINLRPAAESLDVVRVICLSEEFHDKPFAVRRTKNQLLCRRDAFEAELRIQS